MQDPHLKKINSRTFSQFYGLYFKRMVLLFKSIDVEGVSFPKNPTGRLIHVVYNAC